MDMKKRLLPVVPLLLSLSANATLSDNDFFSNDYIKEWGRLKLVDNQLSSETEKAIQLKGWTTYGINKAGAMDNLTDEDFDAMKTWGANVVRLSVIPKDADCEYTATTDSLLKVLIERASQRKMYAIVNWNIIYEDYAKHQEKAKTMFGNISKWAAETGHKNVLYDIAGAGNITASWNDLKKYAEELLPIIEENDPGAMVIVGTPNFNHYTNLAAESPIVGTKYPNIGILYSCQFYACTHINTVDAYMRSAAASIPLFVSEWGSTRMDLEGNELCAENSDLFLSHINRDNDGKQLISWCYWVWGDDGVEFAETGTTKDNTSPYGEYILNVIGDKQKDCCNQEEGTVTQEGLTESTKAINICPNPTNGKFTVSTEGPSRIDIYNLMGEKVYSQEAEGETEIDQQLTNGIYTVRITNERGEKSLMLIKK